MAPRESRLALPGASLYVRERGQGPPLVVLHGGPDFDHRYLLPDLDRLGGSFRLVYYDQRGRGLSAAGVRAEDVSMRSEVDDLYALRRYLGVETMALLGHSRGAVQAIEYAARHPEHVSHLVLMNPAPLSKEEFDLTVSLRRQAASHDVAELDAMAATPAYASGDPDTVAAYYRVHFRRALARPADLDRVIASLRASFTSEGILLARAIEDRLTDETWRADAYDPFAKLATPSIPTLIIAGDHDTVPAAVMDHMAAGLHGARVVTLQGCGHFAYLECPDATQSAIETFLEVGGAPPSKAR